MNAPIDNAAARLHQALGLIVSSPTDLTIERAFGNGMRLSGDESQAEYVQALAKLLALPDEVHAQISALPGMNTDLFLRWVEPTKHALSYFTRGGETFQVIHHLFAESHVDAVAFCADALHRQAPEPYIEEANLPGLVDLVRQLIEEVIADDSLPVNVSSWLVARLNEVENALNMIRLAGYDGAEAALERLIGGSFVEPGANTPQVRSWIWRVFDGIRSATTGVQQLAGAGESAFKALEAGRSFLDGSGTG